MDISIIQRSSFIALDDRALLSNECLSYMGMQTSNEVKRCIEATFFKGYSIKDDFDHNAIEVHDALVINCLVGMQHEVIEAGGSSNWRGILNSYDMPKAYRDSFELLQDDDDRMQGMMTSREFSEAMGDKRN